MIGPRVGLQVGLRALPAIGCGVDELAGGAVAATMAGVTRDATSNIYAPSSLAEWNTTIAVLGFGAAPAHLYLCQEAGGDLIATLGAVNLVATNTPTYQNTESGWSRKFVSGTASGAQFNGNLANPATTSLMFLTYMAFTGGAVLADVIGETDNNGPKVQLVADNTKRVTAGGNLGSGATTAAGSVIPVVVQYDRTNGKTVLYTLDEKITAVYSSTAIGTLLRMITARPAAAGNLARYGYLAEFTGAGAEITTTQVKTMLTTLSWTPTFTP